MKVSVNSVSRGMNFLTIIMLSIFSTSYTTASTAGAVAKKLMEDPVIAQEVIDLSDRDGNVHTSLRCRHFGNGTLPHIN